MIVTHLPDNNFGRYRYQNNNLTSRIYLAGFQGPFPIKKTRKCKLSSKDSSWGDPPGGSPGGTSGGSTGEMGSILKVTILGIPPKSTKNMITGCTEIVRNSMFLLAESTSKARFYHGVAWLARGVVAGLLGMVWGGSELFGIDFSMFWRGDSYPFGPNLGPD